MQVQHAHMYVSFGCLAGFRMHISNANRKHSNVAGMLENAKASVKNKIVHTKHAAELVIMNISSQ